MAQNVSQTVKNKKPSAQEKGLLGWARANSLWYYHVGSGCCADEVISTMGCRYDMERFGCLPQNDPSKADLLFVSTLISNKLKEDVIRIYHEMLNPKYVIAVGACACSGGPFCSSDGVSRVDNILSVDVYIPGCPPRPEAVMYGILKLRESISGVGWSPSAN